MTYTVRYAHLRDKPIHKIGDTIKRGDIIGTMGNSGSTEKTPLLIHLHLDCVEGEHTRRYTLVDMETGIPRPAPRQLNLFVDSELFGVEPVITTYYAEPGYQLLYGKIHCGYDLVPTNRKYTEDNFNIHWNRSAPSRVVQVLDDPAGYGNCIYISYEV